MASRNVANKKETSRRPTHAAFDFHVAPGHLIRRAQQIAVALFVHELREYDITPIQFAFLSELSQHDEIDQVTLATRIAVDVATLGQVARRLEERKLIRRADDVTDRRKKRLVVSGDGEKLLNAVIPKVHAAQKRILAPLQGAERTEFLRLLEKLVGGNNELSRVPMLQKQAHP